jgi:perosamine synthetase
MLHNRREPIFFYRGRAALYAILRTLGIGPNSRVLLQAFTCSAVPEAIMAFGAKPIYVDVGQDSINMCPAALKRALSERGDAVIVQHTFGIPSKIEDLLKICDARGIPVIEDCCHVLGFPSDGGLGSWGAASFYSFEWGKPIPVGIGGAAVANVDDIERRLRSIAGDLASPPLLRQIRLEAQYYFFHLFYKPKRYWRLKRAFNKLSKANIAEGNFDRSGIGRVSSEFGWAISSLVLPRIRRAENQLAERRDKMSKVVRGYREGIRNKSFRHLIECDNWTRNILARYPLMTDRKNEILLEAERHNIEVAGWYTSPVHPFHGMELESAGYSSGSCPNAEAAANSIISLPVHNSGRKDIEKIINFMNGAR